MLPVENFIRTNFVDGIRFNPEQIQLTDKYFDTKLGLINAYGIGQGILVGFKNSLQVVIENDHLILTAGALIDNEGNIIYVNKRHVILNNLSLKQFEDKKSFYVYIKHEINFEDLQESKFDKDVKIHYKISESFKVVVQEKSFRDKSLVELARFYVDPKYGTNLKTPLNPFNPAANEIDIRFAPKVISNNHGLNQDEKILVSAILRKYANFLNELGFRKKLFTAMQTAAFAYKVETDVKVLQIAPRQLYDLLYELLNISLQIYNEREEIVNTAYWKNIKRLQSIFNFTEKYQIDYYATNLEIDSSFFSKVIMHYSNAAVFDGDWDAMLQDEIEEEEVIQKDYLIVGSAQNCDIIVEGDDIASEHAKLYVYKSGYFIEDLQNTSGVYVNAEKLDKGVKQFIRHQDYVVLGKNGKVLNLQQI